MNTHVETFTSAVERMERRAAERDAKLAERVARLAERDAEQARRSLITSFVITGIILAALGVASGVIIAFG